MKPSAEKYFRAKAAPGTSREAVLHVAVAHWPIERSRRGENPEITPCQVRAAAKALIGALPLTTRNPHLRLQRASAKLLGDQHNNYQARRSHTQTRLLKLEAIGINFAELPCCTPR